LSVYGDVYSPKKADKNCVRAILWIADRKQQRPSACQSYRKNKSGTFFCGPQCAALQTIWDSCSWRQQNVL